MKKIVGVTLFVIPDIVMLAMLFLIRWNERMSAVRAMEEGTAIVAVAMLWALLKSAGLHLWRGGKT
jgi:chromate transport protein ChrA